MVCTDLIETQIQGAKLVVPGEAIRRHQYVVTKINLLGEVFIYVDLEHLVLPIHHHIVPITPC